MLSDLLLCNVFSALPLFCQGVDWAEISKQLLAVRFMAICGDSLRIAYAVAIVCREYRGGSPTAVQVWRPCPLWEPSPSHPILL